MATSPAGETPDADAASGGLPTALDLRRPDLPSGDEIVQLFFAEAPIGLCVIDPDLNVAQVNQALCDFGGVGPEDLIGHDVTEVLRTYLSPADFAGILPLTTEVIAGTRDHLRRDATFRHILGEPRFGHLSAWVVRNDDRSIRFIVVTIEDTAELRLPGDHVVRLESRAGDRDGEVAIGMGALVRTALRMRPDRIVVGEVRGGEALAMLAAMNTGHEGSMSTLHANSPPDALRRLESMVLDAGSGLSLLAVRQHVAAAVDAVVQVARHPGGGRQRQIVAVDEITPPSGDGAGAPATRPLVRGDLVVAVPQRWRRPAPGVGADR